MKTIKQVADMLHTSKTTINKMIKKLNITPQKEMINNQQVLVLNDLEIAQLIRDYLDRHPTAAISGVSAETTANNGGNHQQQPQTVYGTDAETATNQPQTPTNQTEKQPQTAEKSTENQAELQRALDILEEQLKQKDMMIQDLQNKLSSAYNQISDLANKAHYITAADKTNQLLENEKQQTTTKKWFSFFKH